MDVVNVVSRMIYKIECKKRLYSRKIFHTSTSLFLVVSGIRNTEINTNQVAVTHLNAFVGPQILTLPASCWPHTKHQVF